MFTTVPVRLPFLRHRLLIRTASVVAACEYAQAKGPGARKVVASALSRGDEPAVCMAYQLATFGKPIPNSLKRALRDKLSSLDEYTLGKYRMESRQVKTVDVVNLLHPSANAGLGKLVKGELKQENTWENHISQNGSTKESWEWVIDNLFVIENEQS